MVDGGGATNRSYFDLFVEGVLGREGEATDDPDDPGGETHFGIARKFHPDIPWPPTKPQAIEIYRSNYWTPIRGDDLPAPLALVCFDAAVVPGVTWTRKALQKVLGVTADGVIGPKTIAAAERSGPETVIRFTDARIERFRESAAARPKSQKYLKGWRWRCLRVMREAVLLERTA